MVALEAKFKMEDNLRHMHGRDAKLDKLFLSLDYCGISNCEEWECQKKHTRERLTTRRFAVTLENSSL